MPPGTGTCCCQCQQSGLFNDQFVLVNQIAGANWHTVRLGIGGGLTDPACSPFFSSSVPDLGFLLFAVGGGIYQRTGRPDGVEIELKTRAAPYDTSIDGGTTFAYAPEYIHLSLGSLFLNFDYGATGSPAFGDQALTISTNCVGSCAWAAAAISSWISPRHVLLAALTPTMTLTVSGVTAGMFADPNCVLHNKSWPIPFASALTFDGYVTDAAWTYLSSPEQAGFDFHALGLPGVCLGPFLPALSAAVHSPAGGYFIQTALLCANAKDAHSAAWPNRTFPNLQFCGACGFGCDVTGMVVTVSE